MSQSDVEALLAQLGNSEPAAAEPAAAEEKVSAPRTQAAHGYDFSQGSFLAPIEVRHLRLVHDDFIAALEARFATYLRTEIRIQMSKLETVSFKELTEELANPSQITLFHLDPLEGVGLLEISSALALSIVDRRTGGPGTCSDAARDMSAIEMALLKQPIDLILTEWCNVWEGMADLRPSICGHETNSQFLRCSRSDAMMLLVAMELQMNEKSERLQLGLPLSTLEPLVEKLNARSVTDKPRTAGPPRLSPERIRSLSDVKINVCAQWSSVGITARQLAELKVGDVIPLHDGIASEVNVLFEKRLKYTAELGTTDNCWAIRLLGNPS